ncbi:MULTISPECIES: GGDEF domain-containing protein [unclassified Novosphingobium]|uniref:GGDEF domain-containing protein n=1 Tax=unclassified Novosphingobium TaxID=2644732 RepID=UPI00146EA130|nr:MULTISPECIES: GGDEF domain-containing protein [unclassified Novosphingobium]NMN05431.1 diguanylate cyclase (GGDEF)-like protein [Novosphingobium sp. SG919]NMN87726.1 diguanylate cyclase (GGDEF)-like protein [Novosphingobium sp. SG916]
MAGRYAMMVISQLLDIGTLLIINALIATMSLVALAVATRHIGNRDDQRGAAYVAAGYGLIAAGFAILFAPGFIPVLESGALWGNALLDLGTIAHFLALNAICQRHGAEFWVLPVALALGLCELALVARIGPDMRMMVALGAGLRACVAMATVFALWRCHDPARRPIALILAGFHIAWIVMLVLRITWWLGSDASGRGSDPTSSFGLTARLLLTWAIAPCYLWMIKREVDAELIRHARQDPLTGVANRRVIWQLAEARCGRPRGKVGVIAIDIDHFKQINDRYGHGTGDAMLMLVAEVLNRNLRSGDVLGRIGGEEFLILLADDKIDARAGLAERLRQAVADAALTLPDGTPLSCTISLGHAAMALPGKGWEAAVQAADRALYAAKHGGRNRAMGAEELAA